MRFWSMQGGWVEPLQFRKRELFKQVNGSPLYLANQLSILSLGYLKHWSPIANGAVIPIPCQRE